MVWRVVWEWICESGVLESGLEGGFGMGLRRESGALGNGVLEGVVGVVLRRESGGLEGRFRGDPSRSGPASKQATKQQIRQREIEPVGKMIILMKII